MKDLEDQIRYLTWSACDKINKLVELIPANNEPGQEQAFAAVHAGIDRVRSHLAARSNQTATPLILPDMSSGMAEHIAPVCEPLLIFESNPGSEPDPQLKALLGI